MLHLEDGCRYFLIRSCSKYASSKLAFETSILDATSNVRNPQPSSIATETTEYLPFQSVIT
ncbi:hypothetical protein [Clostridium beijerinckii]|uniref:hypothetical protein n=1 Tax=Clostridium beijerinckii TaxID=1520 RepID=UPI001F43CDF0|nr:hypothetical protein [Clostridium beijerinckii]